MSFLRNVEHLPNQVLKRKHRHAYDNRADHSRHDEKQGGLGESHQYSKSAVQLRFVCPGDPHEFFIKAAAFFGHGHHFHHLRGEQLPGSRQASRKGSPALHVLHCLSHGVGEGLIADGLTSHAQCKNQRDTGPEDVPSIRQNRTSAK